MSKTLPEIVAAFQKTVEENPLPPDKRIGLSKTVDARWIELRAGREGIDIVFGSGMSWIHYREFLTASQAAELRDALCEWLGLPQ